MSAPIFDRPQATSPSASATRRRRLPLLIVASLMVAGAGLGTGVALATRHPAGPPAVAVAAAGTGSVARTQPSSRPAMPVGQSKPKADARASRASKATGSAHRGPAPVDTAGNAAVLPDGVHHAYIRRVDIARDRITVDVDQLFLAGDAVKAAVADGKSREDAQVPDGLAPQPEPAAAHPAAGRRPAGALPPHLRGALRPPGRADKAGRQRPPRRLLLLPERPRRRRPRHQGGQIIPAC